MGRILNAFVLTLGLYGCSDKIDLAHPVSTTVADIMADKAKYEGKAVKFRDYGPFFVTKSGLRGFFDADRRSSTDYDRLESQTKCNDWNRLHQAAGIFRKATMDRMVSEEVEVHGVIRNGNLEISCVRGEGGFVYIPLEGTKVVIDR